jgi:uncharacterized membrane protein YqjE
VTVLVFFFYRRFVGTTLTENLGLTLGLAGSSLLLIGAHNEDRKYVLFGIFLLSVGMNVRAGALLVLPVLVLWASWVFRGKSRISASILAWGILAVAIGFMINWGTERLVVDAEVSASETGMFSKYSTTFYGLAGVEKGGLTSILLTLS